MCLDVFDVSSGCDGLSIGKPGSRSAAHIRGAIGRWQCRISGLQKRSNFSITGSTKIFRRYLLAILSLTVRCLAPAVPPIERRQLAVGSLADFPRFRPEQKQNSLFSVFGLWLWSIVKIQLQSFIYATQVQICCRYFPCVFNLGKCNELVEKCVFS